MTGLIIVTGIGAGVGLWLILVGCFPPPPRLAHLLEQPGRLARPAEGEEPEPVTGWAGRWGRPAVRVLRAVGLPTEGTRDCLAAVDKPVDVHLAEQATSAIAGLLLPFATAAGLALAGVDIGARLPVFLSVVLSVAGFLAPEAGVRADAARHRAAFRDALSSFLDLVVICLASGAGVDQALDEAAAVGSGPAFVELRYALAEARLARVPPWDILADLGRRVGVPELRQLAATVGLAGTEGAKVRSSLRSRAIALRERRLTDAEGEANAATERMALPIVALFAGFLIFLGYPALATVLYGI